MCRKYDCIPCLPCEILKIPDTLNALKCWQLILRKVVFFGDKENIIISKRNKEMLGLSRLGYLKGIAELEALGLISIEKKVGRACRISVNVNFLDNG